jgi:hypothetical protein
MMFAAGAGQFVVVHNLAAQLPRISFFSFLVFSFLYIFSFLVFSFLFLPVGGVISRLIFIFT